MSHCILHHNILMKNNIKNVIHIILMYNEMVFINLLILSKPIDTLFLYVYCQISIWAFGF